jgi:hypothetical protein
MSNDKPYEPSPTKKGDWFITVPVQRVQLRAETARNAWSTKGKLLCSRTTDTRTYYKTDPEAAAEGYKEKSEVSFHKFSTEAAVRIDESFAELEQRRQYLQSQLDVVMSVLTEELDKALVQHEQTVNRVFDGERYKYMRFTPSSITYLTPIDEALENVWSARNCLTDLQEIKKRRFIPTIELIGRIDWLEYALDHGLVKRRKGKVYGHPGDVFVVTELGNLFIEAVTFAKSHGLGFKTEPGYLALRDRFVKLHKERKNRLGEIKRIRREREEDRMLEMAEAARAAEQAHFAALEAEREAALDAERDAMEQPDEMEEIEDERQAA